MAKVTYASLKLKTNTDVETFDFNGKIIEVLKYLPIEEKYDLVNITLQQSEENGVYNPVKLDTMFHLNLVYMYTNITFTDKQKENEMELYDTLQSSGFIDQVLLKIDDNEYSSLQEYLEILINDRSDYNKSFNGILQNFVKNISANASQMSDIMQNFDPNQFTEVLNFAKAANGGRDI